MRSRRHLPTRWSGLPMCWVGQPASVLAVLPPTSKLRRVLFRSIKTADLRGSLKARLGGSVAQPLRLRKPCQQLQQRSPSTRQPTVTPDGAARTFSCNSGTVDSQRRFVRAAAQTWCCSSCCCRKGAAPGCRTCTHALILRLIALEYWQPGVYDPRMRIFPVCGAFV